jgi:hypothetical protein
VSPSGNDSHTGCTQDAPAKTIGGALGHIKTAKLAATDVHVCRGSYPEHTVTLDVPVSLHGGYDCASWTRHEPFGWTGVDASARALGFDATNETIIDAVDAQNGLSVTSAAVTKGTTVDGFTIKGRGANGGNAVTINSGAPTLSNDVITGAPTGTAPGIIASAGVMVTGDAAPEITHCRINGGGGSAPAGARFGSVGVYLATTGVPLVHDDEIDGGGGTSSAVNPSAGVLVDPPTKMTGDGALRGNSIFYSGVSAVTEGSIWGVAALAPVDVIDNVIIGGAVSCPATAPCNIFGIGFAAPGGTVAENRIWAGTAQGTTAIVWGIYILDPSTNVTVINNQILTGAGQPATAVAIATQQNTSTVLVAANTLYGGGAPATEGIRSFAANATIEANLIVGMNVGLNSGGCSKPAQQVRPVAFQNNALVAVAEDRNDSKPTPPDPTSCAPHPLAVDPTLDVLLPVGTCGASFAECVSNTFGDAPTLATLIAGGLHLSPNTSCKIVNSVPGDVLPTVPTDALKAVRTKPISIGAIEDETGQCK